MKPNDPEPGAQRPVLAWALAAALMLPAAGLQAYQEQVKRYGTLIEATDQYQIYLSHIMTCKAYDFGQGTEHWLRAAAIFQSTETLPLQADFEIFFGSVLLPKIKAVAPAACKAGSVKITNLRVDFYFAGYEPEDESSLGQGRVAEASAFLLDDKWAFQSNGHPTMDMAKAERAESAERMAAERDGEPHGEALKWIQVSTVSKSAHPPGASSSNLIAKNDSLAIYSGDGYSENLCQASSKRVGDFFLNLTLLVSEDAVIPARTRTEYEEFFGQLFPLLEEHCPKANIASVVHYMRGKSHPHYFDQPYINRITLQRYETGRWKVERTDTGGNIFISAAHLAVARQTWLESRDPADSAIRPDVYLGALGKLLFAMMAEGARREAVNQSSEPGQLLSTLGRDGLIASGLTDLFPNAREEQLQYMTRYIGLALSGRLTTKNVVQGTLREYLVQQLEKEDVLAGNAARFADLLIDLEPRSPVKPPFR